MQIISGFKVRIHGQNESAVLMSNVGLLVSARSKTTMGLIHKQVCCDIERIPVRRD